MPNEFDAALSYFTPSEKALAEARKKRLKKADSYEQGYREGQQLREEQERAAQEQLKEQERLDKERAKAEAEQADLERKQRLADTEATYRRAGRPTFTDALGEIRPVDDDETWQRKQAEKKVAEDLKAQARADAAFRKSEAVRLNQAETKLKAGLDDFDAAEAIGSQAVSAKASEIISLSQAYKAASDDTLPPAQRTQITSTPDYQQWLAGQPPESKDNPFAIGDYLATRIQSARKEKEILENSERTIKVAKLNKEQELKPALGDIQNKRDVLPITTAPAIPKGAGVTLQNTVATATPTPASADPERAAAVLRTQITVLREKGDFARADALERRLTNPAKWQAEQKAFRQTATPEQLAQTIEAGSADIEQQWQATQQTYAVLSTQRQAYLDRMERAKAKNDSLLNQPYSDGDVAIIRDETTGEETRWHKAAADEYNGALQGLNGWQQANQEKIDLLDLNRQQLQIEAQNLQKHENQLRYLGREQQRQKDGEQAAVLTQWRKTPGMAEFADETERRAAEFKQRQVELERKYPDPKVRQIAAQALQEDFAKSEESMRERMAAKEKGINSLYANYGSTTDIDDWQTTDRSPINLKKLAEDRGITEQEARTILDTGRKADWRRALPGDEKGVRKLPSGQLSVDPKLWLDPKDYEKAVNDSDATPEAKKAAISVRRDLAAPDAAAMLLDLQKVPEFAEYLAKKTSGTPVERMEQFQADLKAGGALAASIQRMQGGTSSLASSALSAVAAVTGSDYFRGKAEEYQQRAQAFETAGTAGARGTNAVGNFTSKIAGAAPSLLGAMVPGGLALRGAQAVNAFRLASTAARAAQMRQVVAGFKGAAGAYYGTAVADNLLAASHAAMMAAPALNRVALAGAALGSGAQSFGGTYLEAIQAFEKQGLSPTEAHGRALGAALLSGGVTTALTALSGLRGAESLLAQKELVKKTLVARAKEIGIGFADEALEEGIDQLAQGIIALHTYNPSKKIEDILSESLEAALIGGVLGGGMTALSETADHFGNKGALLAEDLAAADAEITNYQDDTADTTENDHRRNRAALAKAIAQGVGLDGIEEVILNSAGWTRKDKDGVTRADGSLTKIKDYTGPNVLDVDSAGKVKLDKTYVSKLAEVMPVTAGLVGSKQTTWHKPGQIEDKAPERSESFEASAKKEPISPAPATPAPSSTPSSGEVGKSTPAGTPQTRGSSAQGAASVTARDTEGQTQAAAPAVSGAAAAPSPTNQAPAPAPDSKEAVAALLPTYSAGDPRPQRAWEIANHLEMAGLDRASANLVAASAIRSQGIKGKTVNDQVTSPEFNQLLDDLGATGDRTTREGSAPLALTRAPTPPKVSQPTASPAPAKPSPTTAKGARPEYPALRAKLAAKEMNVIEALREVIRLSGETDTGVLQDLLTDHLGLKKPSAAAAVETLRAAGELKGDKNDDISIASSKRASDRQSTPSDKAYTAAKEFVPATQGALAENPAWARAKLSMLARTPPARRRWAYRFLTQLENTISQRASLYDAFAVGQTARQALEGNKIAVVGIQGKTTLAIDLDRMLADFSYLGDPRAAAVATVMEEDIHAAQKHLEKKGGKWSKAALRQQWRDLPDDLKKAVWQAYNNVKASDNQSMPTTWDNDTAYHMQSEFLRMLVQGRIDPKSITEAVDASPSLIQSIKDLLADLYDTLRSLIKGLPTSQAVTLDQQVTELKAALEQLGKPSTAEELRTKMFLRDPSAVAMQALKNGTVFDQLATQDALFTPEGLRRVWDLLTPEMQAQVLRLKKTAAPWLAKKRTDNAALTRDLLTFLLDPRAAQALAQANLTGSPAATASTGMVRRALKSMGDYFRSARPDFAQTLGSLDLPTAQVLQQMQSLLVNARAQFEASAAVQKLPTLVIAEPQADDEDTDGPAARSAKAMIAAWMQQAQQQAFLDQAAQVAEQMMPGVSDALQRRAIARQMAGQTWDALKARMEAVASGSPSLPVSQSPAKPSPSLALPSPAMRSAAAIEEALTDRDNLAQQNTSPAARDAIARRLLQEEWSAAILSTVANAERRYYLNQQELTPVQIRQIESLLQVAAGDLTLGWQADRRQIGQSPDSGAPVRQMGLSRENALAVLGIRIGSDGTAYAAANAPVYIEGGTILIKQTTLDDLSQTLPITRRQFRLSEDEQRARIGLRGAPQPVTAATVFEARAADQQQQDTRQSIARLEQLEAQERAAEKTSEKPVPLIDPNADPKTGKLHRGERGDLISWLGDHGSLGWPDTQAGGEWDWFLDLLGDYYNAESTGRTRKKALRDGAGNVIGFKDAAVQGTKLGMTNTAKKMAREGNLTTPAAIVEYLIQEGVVTPAIPTEDGSPRNLSLHENIGDRTGIDAIEEAAREANHDLPDGIGNAVMTALDGREAARTNRQNDPERAAELQTLRFERDTRSGTVVIPAHELAPLSDDGPTFITARSQDGDLIPLEVASYEWQPIDPESAEADDYLEGHPAWRGADSGNPERLVITLRGGTYYGQQQIPGDTLLRVEDAGNTGIGVDLGDGKGDFVTEAEDEESVRLGEEEIQTSDLSQSPAQPSPSLPVSEEVSTNPELEAAIYAELRKAGLLASSDRQLAEKYRQPDGSYHFPRLLRGIGSSPNDAGVAGKGPYYTLKEHVAKMYAGSTGRVITDAVTLKRPLIATYPTLTKLQEKLYGRMLTGFEPDLSAQFDTWMRQRGYDGAILFEPEEPDQPAEVVKLAPSSAPLASSDRRHPITGQVLAASRKNAGPTYPDLKKPQITPAKPLDPNDWENNPFGEWVADLKTGDLIGYRGTPYNNATNVPGGFGNTEGNGIYIAKEFDTAAVFGRVFKKQFPQPKAPFIVREGLYLLTEDEITDEPIQDSDSDWLKASKYAVQRAHNIRKGKWDSTLAGDILTALLMEAGYDSVLVKDAPDDWVVLLRLKRPDQKTVPVLASSDRFYSQLARTVEAKMPNRADAKTLRGIVENPQSRIKAEELKWSGLLAWADSQPQPLTKQQVLDYLATEGSVQFEETRLNGINADEDAEQARIYERYRELTDQMADLKRQREEGSLTPSEASRELARISAERSGLDDRLNDLKRQIQQDQTRNTQWTLPGGDNQREVVVTWDRTKTAWDFLMATAGSEDPAILARREQARASSNLQSTSPNVATDRTHYGDLDALAWFRANDRDNGQGLLVEEFQSKWHQRGRDEGYDNEAAFENLIRQRDAAPDDSPQQEALQQQIDAMAATGNKGVPDAPYRSAWPLMLFKRALADAVAEGKQWIGWTTGDTQADRYDLSKDVDNIKWYGDSTGDTNVEIYFKKHSSLFLNVNPSGIITDANGTGASDMSGKTLADAVGKEIARQIQAKDAGNLTGKGLKVGGEGMRKFYDDILVKEFGKYVKPWGGKVEKSEFESSTSLSEPAWRAFTDSDWDTFGGAEPFSNGDQPLAATVQLFHLQGQNAPTPITAIAILDANGLQIIDSEAENVWAVPNTAFPGHTQRDWWQSSSSAQNSVGVAWKNQEHRFWKEFDTILGKSDSFISPKLGTTPIWRIDITPAMRDSVAAGQALFASARHSFSPELVEEARAEMKANTTDPDYQGGNAWMTPDGRFINLDDNPHYVASGIVYDHGYGPAMAAGYVRVTREGQQMFAEFFGPLSRRIIRQVRDGAIEQQINPDDVVFEPFAEQHYGTSKYDEETGDPLFSSDKLRDLADDTANDAYAAGDRTFYAYLQRMKRLLVMDDGFDAFKPYMRGSWTTIADKHGLPEPTRAAAEADYFRLARQRQPGQSSPTPRQTPTAPKPAPTPPSADDLWQAGMDPEIIAQVVGTKPPEPTQADNTAAAAADLASLGEAAAPADAPSIFALPPEPDAPAMPDTPEERMAAGWNAHPEDEQLPSAPLIAKGDLDDAKPVNIQGGKSSLLARGIYNRAIAALARHASAIGDMFFGTGTVTQYIHKAGLSKPAGHASEYSPWRASFLRQVTDSTKVEALARGARAGIDELKRVQEDARDAVKGSSDFYQAVKGFVDFINSIEHNGLSTDTWNAIRKRAVSGYQTSLKDKDFTDDEFALKVEHFARVHGLKARVMIGMYQALPTGFDLNAYMQKVAAAQAWDKHLIEARDGQTSMFAPTQAEHPGPIPVRDDPTTTGLYIAAEMLGDNGISLDLATEQKEITVTDKNGKAQKKTVKVLTDKLAEPFTGLFDTLDWHDSARANNIEKLIRDYHQVFVGKTIHSANSWLLLPRLAREHPGIGFVIDPPYFGVPETENGKILIDTATGQPVRKGTSNYDSTTDIRTPDDLLRLFDSYVLPAWQSGAKFVLTNEWDDSAAVALRLRGATVVKIVRQGRKGDTPELVAYNFNPTDGTLRPHRISEVTPSRAFNALQRGAYAGTSHSGNLDPRLKLAARAAAEAQPEAARMALQQRQDASQLSRGNTTGGSGRPVGADQRPAPRAPTVERTLSPLPPGADMTPAERAEADALQREQQDLEEQFDTFDDELGQAADEAMGENDDTRLSSSDRQPSELSKLLEAHPDAGELSDIDLTAYRVGALNPFNKERGSFFGDDYQSAQDYASRHPGHVVTAYRLEAKKAFVAKNLHQAWRTVFGKPLDINDIDRRFNFKNTALAWRWADTQLFRKLRGKGYDAFILRDPAPPARHEIALIDKTAKATPLASAPRITEPPFDPARKLLENQRIHAIDTLLHGNRRPIQNTPPADQAGSSRTQLAAALAHLRGAQRTGRSSAPDAATRRKEDRRRDKAALIDWARDAGILIDKLPPRFKLDSPKDKGGAEHHVFEGDRWLKVTKGSGESFGFMPRVRLDEWDLDRQDATANSYLEKLQLLNQVFHDDLVLHAVFADRLGNVALVTSQPDYEGTRATQEQDIKPAMEAAGFIQLSPPSAYYRPSDNLVVVDIHTENAIVQDNGTFLRVFDGVLLHPTGALREVFARIAQDRKDGLMFDDPAQPLASSTRTPAQTIEATGLAPAISVNGQAYTGRPGMFHGAILGDYVWRKVFTPQQRRDDPNQDNAVNYAYDTWMDSRGSGFDDFGFLDTRTGKFLTREEAYTTLTERGFTPPPDSYSIRNESLDSSDLFNSTKNQEPGTKSLPAADRILAAAQKTNTNPTKPQQDAENYQTGKVTVHGLRLSIENPRGSVRKGTDANGKAWEITMPHHYGRILGTTGADKDHVDFFLGPDPTSPMAFVVNQKKPGNGHFDEHKVMLGFTNPGTAARGYLDSYSPGWRGYHSIVPMTIPQLKHWLEHGKMSEAVTKAPVVSNDTKPKPTRPATTHTFPDGYHLTGPGLHLLPASIRAYHGTPHEIDPKTGFSTSKIGTGEGAQVYGWGLYFAEAMKVAEQYRRTLSTPVLIIGDKEFTRREGADAFTEWAANQLPKDWPHMAVSRFKEVLNRFHYDVTSFVAHPDEAADDARKVFEKFLRASEVSNDVFEQAMTALGNIVDYAEAPSPQDTTEGRWYARAIGWKPSIVRNSIAAGAFYDMFSRIGWYASTFQNAPSVLQTEYEQTIIAQNEELERLRSDPNAAQNKPQINAALDRIRIAETALGMLKDGRVKLLPNPRRGNFYTVDILGDPEQFLLWDEPLSKQSQFIRDAFTLRAGMPMTEAQKKAFTNLRLNGDVEARQAKHDAVLKQREAWFVQTKAKNNSDYAWDWPAEDQRRLEQWNDQLLELDKDIRGAYQGFGELYRQFTADSNGTPKDTSEFLAGMGIKGVRYLDGSSRSSGQGTHNYVIFDDKLVRILEKNGQPIDTPALASSNKQPLPAAPDMDNYQTWGKDKAVRDSEWKRYRSDMAKWEAKVAEFASKQGNLGTFLAPLKSYPGGQAYREARTITRVPGDATRWRATIFGQQPITATSIPVGDWANNAWVPVAHNEFETKAEAYQSTANSMPEGYTFSTQPLFASNRTTLAAAPRFVEQTSRASFNHLDRWFTGALARQAKRVTSSDPVTAATQAAAAWWNQDTPGVSTLRSLKELAQRELLPETVLPREIMSAMREMQIKQSMGQQKALDVGRALSDKPKFSDLHYPPEFVENPMHREQMFTAMEQGKVDTLPPALQEVAKKLRQMLVEAGREAVKQGRMNPDTFEGLRTNFMPRFTKEEAQASAGDFAKRFKLGVKDILAQRSTAFHITDTSRKDKNGLPQIVSHAKGKWRFDSKQARDAYYEDLINRQTLDGDLAKNDMHWMNRGDARALRSITPEMLKAPATMTKEQREVVARVQRQLRNQFKKEDPYEPKDLVKDPVYAVMRYLAQMTHDNAVAEFFNVIGQNPDWTSSTEMKGFTQIPNNDRFGTLAGKFVRKDIADQVMELAHTPAQVIQLYDTLLRLWKTGKTVLNPATHARNIIGNLPFAQFAGNNALNPANWPHYVHAMRTLREGGDEYRQLYETGVLGADYASTELRAALENIVPVVQEDDNTSPIRHLIALGNRAAQWGKAHSLANVATLGSVGATAGFIAAGPVGALAGAGIAAAANPIYRTALWAYRLEDDLFKAAAFFKARSMGMTLEQASQHVRDWFPYYDKPTSTTLKFAGRTTMPFLSFFRESARIGAKAAKERPLSLAVTLSIPTIITALSQAALGLDDEDMEDVKAGMRGKGAKLLGMTPLAGVPIFSMLIPWRTSSGQLQQIDLSSTHPMADFLANRVENWNNDPWWQAWSRSALANPMLGVLYTAATGRDPFGDRTLWDSSYTPDEKAKAILGHAWKTAMPPLAPGGTNWTMIEQSTRRQANKTLALRSPAQAVARGVAGVDVRSADPDIYSLADAFRKRRGLPVTEGNVAYPTDPAGRARKALFEELVQPQPSTAALAKLLQTLNDLGKPVRTVADVLDILDYRRPDGVINPKELRAPFRASLAHEARRVLDTALKEFQRARAATPGAFAKARQQIKPTTRTPITEP